VPRGGDERMKTIPIFDTMFENFGVFKDNALDQKNSDYFETVPDSSF